MIRMLAVAVFASLLATPAQMTQYDAETALAKAEAAWSAKKPKAYEFTIKVTCLCSLPKDPPIFHVADGVSLSMSSMAPEQRRTYALLETVEKQFEAIRGALRRSPFKADVKFDPLLGYPTHVAIDPFANIADDEILFDVSGFRSADSSAELDRWATDVFNVVAPKIDPNKSGRLVAGSNLPAGIVQALIAVRPLLKQSDVPGLDANTSAGLPSGYFLIYRVQISGRKAQFAGVSGPVPKVPQGLACGTHYVFDLEQKETSWVITDSHVIMC